MEQSILKSVKKVLGIDVYYTEFDPDIMLFASSALSDLNQIGIGPSGGLTVDDDSVMWDALGLPENMLNLAKACVCLKVRMMFDPPTTSFTQDAMNKQIEEKMWRLSIYRETQLPATVTSTTVDPFDGTVETTVTEEVVTW